MVRRERKGDRERATDRERREREPQAEREREGQRERESPAFLHSSIYSVALRHTKTGMS